GCAIVTSPGQGTYVQECWKTPKEQRKVRADTTGNGRSSRDPAAILNDRTLRRCPHAVKDISRENNRELCQSDRDPTIWRGACRYAAVDIQARNLATSVRTVRDAAKRTTASTAAIAGTMNIAECSPSARNGSSAGGRPILGPPRSARTC